jgi:dUTP pyrophosphatase
MQIRIKKLNDDAVMPQYARAWDAGADLFSTEDFKLPAHSCGLVPTGIAIEIPAGFVGLIHPRSGLATKGVTVMNAPGTIDAGYRGEIKVILVNHTDKDYDISKGDKIAQLVIQEVREAHFIWSDELSNSERGNGGFGSTGKNKDKPVW